MRMTEEQYAALLSKRSEQPTPKPSKYRNKKVMTDEGTFDSRHEYNVWCQRKMEQAAGVISGLRRQVSYELVPSANLDGRKLPPVRYVADFVYLRDGETVVEDAKGMASLPDFKIKRRLMWWLHGIRVIETRK